MADEAITLLRRRVSAWLRHPDPRGAQLIRWLQGYDLPSAQGREEPYQLVLRGLPIGRERHNAAAALAKRAAELLRREPEVKGIGKAPAALCYNLLGLCAALDYPDDLAEPLDEMLARKRLRGDWQGHDLRRALLRALETNQTDARHKTMWNTMLEGRGNRFLGGTPEDGFHGILRCPSAGRGNPDVDAIGHALAVLARGYRRNPDRSLIFDDLLDQVTASYLRPDWPRLLLETAHRHKWPSWAALRLPPFAELEEKEPGYKEVIVPSSIAESMNRLNDVRNGHRLLGGLVQKLRIPVHFSRLILWVETDYERYRRELPPSVPSTSPVDAAILNYVEDGLRARRDRCATMLADAIREFRAEELARQGIGFNPYACAAD
jgi:hypothetical protein